MMATWTRWPRDPFPIGINSDDGSEFINHHLLEWSEGRRITFTRSHPAAGRRRPVEQKNSAVVGP